jgi:PAS domain-containing protein
MSFFGAFAIFAAALALRLLILPVESRLGVLTFYPAAAACFCFFGKWPGRLVVLLSAVTVYYVFTPPHWSWTPSAEGFWSIAVFVVFSEWLGVTVERAKRDHAALHRQKQQFEAIVQDQSEAIYRFRSDGTVLFVNEAFCRMFGVKAEDIVGHHWAPVVYPDDLPQVTERLAMLSPSSRS